MIKVGLDVLGPMQFPTWSEERSVACCSICEFHWYCLRFSKMQWTPNIANEGTL